MHAGTVMFYPSALLMVTAGCRVCLKLDTNPAARWYFVRVILNSVLTAMM